MYVATFNKIIILKSFEYTLLSDFQKFCHYKNIKTNLIFYCKINYIEKSEAIAKTNSSKNIYKKVYLKPYRKTKN